MHTYMKNTMPTREDVLHFLSTEQQLLGCGSGDGNGHGFGYGDGSGDGSDYEEASHYSRFVHCYSNAFAHGIGSCYGHCYGNSSGSGSGSGSTLLSGYGYGNGSGCGYDFGNGHGEISYNCYNKDIKAFNGYIVDYVNNIPTIITQVHYNIAYGYIINKDLTLEAYFIAKVGSSFGLRKTIKDAFDDAKNIEMERLEEYLNR